MFWTISWFFKVVKMITCVVSNVRYQCKFSFKCRKTLPNFYYTTKLLFSLLLCHFRELMLPYFEIVCQVTSKLFVLLSIIMAFGFFLYDRISWIIYLYRVVFFQKDRLFFFRITLDDSMFQLNVLQGTQ